MDTTPDRESVCVARSAADEARIERVLTRLAIDYQVRLEGTEQASRGAVCFMAMIYDVPQSDADRARRALGDEGLGERLLWPKDARKW